MWGKSEGKMEHGMGMEHVDPLMMAIWHKSDDATKKMWAMRMLDEKIMMKEFWIKHMQHKLETMKMLKTTMEKM